MSCNYYAKVDICNCCGSPKEVIHLGKSSVGWKFNLRWNVKYYSSFDELVNWLNGETDIQIEDEYGKPVSISEFVKFVRTKQDSGMSHFEYIQEHHPEDSKSFTIDGYEFTDCEFS